MEENKNTITMAEQQNTFYNYHPDIFHAVSGKSTDIENEIFFYAVSRKSDTLEILNAVSAQLYMPTQEELRREIEQQKEFFRLQHKND